MLAPLVQPSMPCCGRANVRCVCKLDKLAMCHTGVAFDKFGMCERIACGSICRSSAREMIKILQENGETVLCVGSAIKPANIGVFAQAQTLLSSV